jgi:sulfatase modifying factor 1
VSEGGLQLLLLASTLAVVSAITTLRCGVEKGDTDTAVMSDTEDTQPGGCIEETAETEAPPDTQESGPPETAEPPDTSPPVETGLVDGCPVGMVPVAGSFCIDAYEASRPDATATSTGSDESYATSRAGVLPWKVDEQGQARAACEAAGKRLCSEDEWTTTCIGPGETSYPYGDDYDPTTCNGIDSNCDCHGSTNDACACDDHGGPYAGCYYDCGGSYGMEPTGSRGGCTNAYGVWDISGNLWEYVDSAAAYPVRGGAYNCGDSKTNHRCDFVPGWNPSARGFRCCHDGEI